MTPTTLLAKSTPHGRKSKSLVDHTRDVVAAAERLFGMVNHPNRLGLCWLRFFRLTKDDWPRFHSALLAACLFHDWGKANANMQEFFHGKGTGQQFRHEHLSVLMLGSDGVRHWVEGRSDIDWDVVIAAVGSHHLRFTHDSFAEEVTDHSVRVFVDHPEFVVGLVDDAALRLKLIGRPAFPSRPNWGYIADAATFDVTDLRKTLRARLHWIKPSPLLLAVRSALIAADAVGSGLPRTGSNIEQWVDHHLDETALCDRALVEEVIRKRTEDLAALGKWGKWNTFQLDCEHLPDRALLLAPCGAGKTLAAWRWIVGCVSRHPVKRVIFLYPTRATATEGFKDYVSWAPEADAALLHGTAEYDLDGMFPLTDERAGKPFDTTDPRLFALRHWSKRIFSATVDQFFAFLSYNYGPMCLLPLLADCVIVVDECHSFDKKMFSALLGFLREFEVPVLCMTATMQAGRKDQLRKLVERVYEDRPDDLATIADAPRYRVKRVGEIGVEQLIRAAVVDGKRVLWVVNQVSRAHDAVAKLFGLKVRLICYHSRFKLDDRVERHRETVAALRAGQPAAVAVATQVCEMSLDIDADVLVTEACPITSLIQRMGRCRRGRDELAAKGPGEVWVYAPSDEKVYSKDDLAGVMEFLDWMEVRPSVSLADLETALEEFGPKGADAEKLNSFLASGAYADSREDTLRDIEAFNVQAVLANEIQDYLGAKPKEQPGFIVPVPRKVKPGIDPRLPHWLHVANDRHYEPRTGFHDTPIR